MEFVAFELSEIQRSVFEWIYMVECGRDVLFKSNVIEVVHELLSYR